MQAQWQPQERKGALLVLASPFLIALASTCTAIPALSTEAIFVFPLILAAAYGSLLFFVLPTIALLRRLVALTRARFAITVAAAGTLPWFLLYMAFFASPSSAKYSGAPQYILLLLTPPLLSSFLVSYFIYPHVAQHKAI